MAHLWIKDETDHWCVMPLVGEGFALSHNPAQHIQSVSSNDDAVSQAVLMRARNGNGKPAPWVLIAAAGHDVRVNGEATLLGVRVLADRDEISVAGVGELFFSTESLAHVEEFNGELTGATPPIYCPRCRQLIEEGVTSVKCPQCGVWYHETEELNCWTYAETCALCPQSSDLDAGFRWTPEDL